MPENDRNARRELKRQLGPKVMQHPYVRRLRRNIKEAGMAATEVYRLDGRTPDEHRYFDVYTMRQWACANLDMTGTWLDWNRAEHLVTSGAVDPEIIRDHSIDKMQDPIIIGIGASGSGNDQVLDGAHRYVAAALAAVSLGLEGQRIPLLSYFLEPGQWSQFLIPNFVAKAFRFDDNYDYEPHRWPEAVA